MVGYYREGTHKYLKKNPSQCHSLSHKSHIDWPAFEPNPIHVEFVVDKVAQRQVSVQS